MPKSNDGLQPYIIGKLHERALLESKILKDNRYSNYIHHWSRYVDDILCIWSNPEVEIQSLIQNTNSLDPAIEFVPEIGGDSRHFLDLQYHSHGTVEHTTSHIWNLPQESVHWHICSRQVSSSCCRQDGCHDP